MRVRWRIGAILFLATVAAALILTWGLQQQGREGSENADSARALADRGADEPSPLQERPDESGAIGTGSQPVEETDEPPAHDNNSTESDSRPPVEEPSPGLGGQPPAGTACPAGTEAREGQCVTACDVLIVGEGMGGVAAALGATSFPDARVCLLAFFDWYGGQATTQGVSALDEGYRPWMWPHFSASYRSFREGIRDWYTDRYRPNPGRYVENGRAGLSLNPGGCWVSHLCFEPVVGHQVLEAMLARPVTEGRLRIYRVDELLSVLVSDDRVMGVTALANGSQTLRLTAAMTLDATELGDVIALAGLPYRTGAEARSAFNEPHAPLEADPECVQSFTYTFILEEMPAGEDYRIEVPNGYDPANYTGLGVSILSGDQSLWTFRRVLAASAFLSPGNPPSDMSMINWWRSGNDFNRSCEDDLRANCNIIDKSPAERAAILQRAEDLALGFAYYLQTDVPWDAGAGRGYPNLRLRTDVFPTANGLSIFPYIREARRINALTIVTEQDIVRRQTATGAYEEPHRAALFFDSVGTGWYQIDIHPCAYDPAPTILEAGLFQIPLRALIPESHQGLLAAAKNIGTTHITNGAYRMHPVEWHIGEAAGIAATYCIQNGCDLRDVFHKEDIMTLRKIQMVLLTQRHMPLFWWGNMDPERHPLFEAVNLLGIEGAYYLPNQDSPETLFYGWRPVTRAYAAHMVANAFHLPLLADCKPSFRDVPCDHEHYQVIQAVGDAGITDGCGAGSFCPDDPISKAAFVTMVVRAAQVVDGWELVRNPLPHFVDVGTGHPAYDFIEMALAQGLLQDSPGGSPATFHPNETIDLENASLILYHALRLRYGF